MGSPLLARSLGLPSANTERLPCPTEGRQPNRRETIGHYPPSSQSIPIFLYRQAPPRPGAEFLNGIFELCNRQCFLIILSQHSTWNTVNDRHSRKRSTPTEERSDFS